jgi:quercetin dioxygenase-like cupin family protein
MGAGALLAGASNAIARPQSARSLMDLAHDLCTRLRSSELTAFLADWPKASAPHHNISPTSLPVLRWLPELGKSAPDFSAALVERLVALAGYLEWRRSYSESKVGAAFWRNYGWTEIFGHAGPRVSDRLACGLLVLGPHVHYPAHRHEADEIYVPLAGAALWQEQGREWHERPAGSVIHHAGNEVHAMRTEAAPLLALYLWQSADLDQKSQLV